MASTVNDRDERPGQESKERLPLAVYMLGLTLFAMGTSEFLISGVLPDIADDLDITLPTAGTLISAFAVGVLVGAPPLAVLTLRLPRRTTLLVSQLLFIGAMAVGLLSSGYLPLLVARFVSGVAYAGFWAVAQVTATSLVSQDRTARALSVVVSGLSLSMIAGGPIGTVIGGQAGWRAGFWAVVIATAVTAVAVWLTLPPERPDGEPRRVSGEVAVMRRPHLWVAYGTTMLTTAAYMGTFGYLGALLTKTAGLSGSWVPGVLALFGIGALAGLTIGGRTADKRPFGTLYAGALAMIVVSVLLALLAEQPAATVVLAFLLGMAGFLVNPAVLGRVFSIAGDAPTLAGASNVSAMQLGITVAPLLGGLSIGAGYGLASVGWVGAVLAAVSLVAILIDSRLAHRERRATAKAPVEATT